jgi:hypothetical protein
MTNSNKAYSEAWFQAASEETLSECLDLNATLEAKAKSEFKRRSLVQGPVPLRPSLRKS